MRKKSGDLVAEGDFRKESVGHSMEGGKKCGSNNRPKGTEKLTMARSEALIPMRTGFVGGGRR